MDHDLLMATVAKMFESKKGLLAADESSNTCDKRFEAVGIEKTEENRRLYRQLLLKTPALEDYIDGVILYDETFWQKTDEGQLFPDYLDRIGILPGIKVDQGLIDLPGFAKEQITQGLDGLPERMQNYQAGGAKFAKWRAAITIGKDTPTEECIGANTFVLARYARICQEYNIVPIVEPEVLFDGNHSIEQCEEVLSHVLDLLFQTMRAFRVDMQGAVLKTSMVLPGKELGDDAMNADDIAERTSRVLYEHVPTELGGVVFLSGGQKPDQAMINLNRIEQKGPYPWGLTFSYSRALQDPVLKHWAANPTDIDGAQDVFLRQLQFASKAEEGKLNESELAQDNFVTESQN